MSPSEAKPADTLRRRLVLLVVSIDVACCLAAGAVEVLNARSAAKVEVAASFEMAEPLVRETVQSFQRKTDGDIADLSFALPGIRHVRISVHRPDGSIVGSRSAARASPAAPAPRWFSALISSRVERIDIPVSVAGKLVGVVAIHGEDADEAAEVWEDMTTLAALFVVLNALGVVAFMLAVGRILAPLRALSDGLSELDRRKLERRLPVPRTAELATLARAFNALAAGLAAERETNRRLSGRMVSLQDDERRQIATELHDELGPCLFGIQANLGLLEGDVGAGRASLGERGEERLAAAIEISDRLQHLNGRLLRRLRPMALGEAPLAEVLAGLIADFERHHADRAFSFESEGLAFGYGAVADLTAYRAIQEGVTNALKHASCSHISTTVEERRTGTGSEVAICVLDDGAGLRDPIAPGFGLAGLEDRLRAVQGRMSLRTTRQGTALDVAFPVPGPSFRLRDGSQ